MNGFDFNEDKQWRVNLERELRKPPRSIQWIMRVSQGHVTNERQAMFVILGVLLLIILLAVFYVYSITSQEREPHPDYYRIYLDQQRRR